MRHTIREYAAMDVPPATLASLLSHVRLAPSSGNMAAWHVVIVRAQETKDALAAAAWGQTFLTQAPVLLVWFANETHSASKYAERGAFYALQDATIAGSYFQLLATSAGLASGWAGAFREEDVAAAVGAGAGLRPIALMSVGFAAQSRERRHRRPLRALASELGPGGAWQPLEGHDGADCDTGEAYCEHPLSAALRQRRAAEVQEATLGAAGGVSEVGQQGGI